MTLECVITFLFPDNENYPLAANGQQNEAKSNAELKLIHFSKILIFKLVAMKISILLYGKKVRTVILETVQSSVFLPPNEHNGKYIRNNGNVDLLRGTK